MSSSRHRTNAVKLLTWCALAAVVACSRSGGESASIAPVELLSFDNEPISLSTAGLPVRIFKWQAQAIDDANRVLANAVHCGSGRTKEYAEELSGRLRANQKTVYALTYEGEPFQGSSYEITMLPNDVGYLTMAHFRKDFADCGMGARPLRLTNNWLVFANDCSDEGCNTMRDAVEPGVEMRK